MNVFLKLLNFVLAFSLASAEMQISVYKMECTDEKDTEYLQNISCGLKTLARGVNSLTLLSDLTKPLYHINANVATLQRSSANIYNSVIFNVSFEVCSIKENSPPVIKLVVPFLTIFAPKFIHPCPYEGKRQGVEDLPIDLSKMPFLNIANIPRGEYRIDMTFYDKEWKLIEWVKLYFSVQPKRTRKKQIGSTNKD